MVNNTQTVFETSILIPSLVFKFIAMIIGVLGNVTIIIYTIFSSREKTATSSLIANLALADLLVCLTFYPLWIIEFIQTISNIESDQDLFCKLSRSSLLTLLFVSVATLLAITVDQYTFIVKPLKYPLIITEKRVRNVVAGIWVISFGVLCLMAVFFKKTERRSYCEIKDEIYWPYEIVIIYLSIIFIFCFNIKVLRIAQKQKQGILKRIPNMNQSEICCSNRKSLLRQIIALKSVKTFIIVFAILAFCCFIPAIIGLSLYFLVGKQDIKTSTWYVVFNFELYGINSIANPFVYGVRHVKYRRGCRELWSNIHKRQ